MTTHVFRNRGYVNLSVGCWLRFALPQRVWPEGGGDHFVRASAPNTFSCVPACCCWNYWFRFGIVQSRPSNVDWWGPRCIPFSFRSLASDFAAGVAAARDPAEQEGNVRVRSVSDGDACRRPARPNVELHNVIALVCYRLPVSWQSRGGPDFRICNKVEWLRRAGRGVPEHCHSRRGPSTVVTRRSGQALYKFCLTF